MSWIKAGRNLSLSSGQPSERSKAMQRVQFTTFKGFADPNETKEFNRVWDMHQAGAITSQELEDWIERTNAIQRFAESGVGIVSVVTSSKLGKVFHVEDVSESVS